MLSRRSAPNKPKVNHLGNEYLIPPQRRNFLRIIRIRTRRILYVGRTNSPYLSGDSFASACDYIAFGSEGKSPIDRESLRSANSIFVVGHRLLDFLGDYGNEVSATTLVSGNSDQNFLQVPELPRSIKLFLCQNNVTQDDPRVHTLPIGLENLRLGRSGLPKLHQPKNALKDPSKVFLPPMSPTNLGRREVMKYAMNNPNVFDVGKMYLPEKKYFEVCHNYKFVFACEGNGFDSHRVWEILYSGSFPVMLLTDWSHTLNEMELPILLIENLTELNSELLENFLKSNSDFDPKVHESMWMPYWSKMICSGLYRKPMKI